MTKSKIGVALCSILLMASCTKTKVENLQGQMEDGTWQITLFQEDGEDETSDYSGYSFVFRKDGAVIASTGSTSQDGTWSIGKDKSNDDSSTDYDFNLSFPEVGVLGELTDDWDIVSQEEDQIVLKHISGGNGGTDYLTFKKI